MSPELFDPKKFGFKDNRRTKCSDCYALGMVIYEVLNRQVPFYHHVDLTVVVRVANGERPRRPRGAERAWFTDDIWSLLEHCWEHSPCNRPRIRDVLQFLEKSSKSWTPPSPQAIVKPPATNPPAQNPDPGTEESTDVSLPSQSISSQSLQELLLKGNPNKPSIYPCAHRSPAPPHGVPGHPGWTSAVNANGSHSEESVGVSRAWFSTVSGIDLTTH